MPLKLPLTWQKALIRGLDFRTIVERGALNLKKEELVSVQQNLEHDLVTTSIALDTRWRQKKIEVAAATSATDTFQVEYVTRKQAIKTSKQAAKAAIMTEIGVQMEAVPS